MKKFNVKVVSDEDYQDFCEEMQQKSEAEGLPVMAYVSGFFALCMLFLFLTAVLNMMGFLS